MRKGVQIGKKPAKNQRVWKYDLMKSFCEYKYVSRGKEYRRTTWTYHKITRILGKKGAKIDDYTLESLSVEGRCVEDKYSKNMVQEYILNLIKDRYDLGNMDQEIFQKISGNKYFFLGFKYIMEQRPDLIVEQHWGDYAIGNDNRQMIEYLVDHHNYKLDGEKFKLACMTANIDILSLMFENKKEIKEEYFDLVLERFGDKIKRENKKDKFGFVQGKDMNDIDELKIFCEYGFHLKQNHLVTMAINNTYLSNYHQFGLVINDEIKEICQNKLFYPYPETKFKIGDLSILIQKSFTITNMRNIVKIHKCEFTLDHLKVLCKNKRPDNKMIRYLINGHNIIPDSECLYNIIAHSKGIKIVRFILSKMGVVDQQLEELNNVELNDDDDSEDDNSEDDNSENDNGENDNSEDDDIEYLMNPNNFIIGKGVLKKKK